MIQMQSITVERAEGPTNLLGTRCAITWHAAQQIVDDNALTAPKDGSYHKHDVTVVWEDGQAFKFRLDVKHPMCHRALLSSYLRGLIRFYSGRHPLPGQSAEEYAACLKATIVDPQYYADLLDKYDMGQNAVA